MLFHQLFILPLHSEILVFEIVEKKFSNFLFCRVKRPQTQYI